MTEQGPHWPIIVLSLEGDDVRRKPLLDSLDALGLDYEVFIGVDGRNGLSPHWQGQIDRDAAHRNVGRPLTDGEFACALSHREIYRRMINEGWEGAIVLEDDAIIGPHFESFMRDGAYRAGPILLLDHSHARVRRRSTELLPGIAMHRLSLSPSLTTAYSIHRDTANILDNANTPVCNIADWPLDISKLCGAVLVPPIVGHPDAISGISHLRQDRLKAALNYSSMDQVTTKRFFSFLRRWMLKRISRRVS